MTDARAPHPIAVHIRGLRRQHHISLLQLEQRLGFDAGMVGSYERGDRRMTVDRADEILAVFGQRLAAVPVGFDLPGLLAEVRELRQFRDTVINAYHQRKEAA